MREDVGWPSFEAPLLESISQAFRRHVGSGHRREHSFLLSSEVEEGQAEPPERLNLDAMCKGRERPASIRLSIWPDGRLWFRACEPGDAGWAFMIAFSGQLPGPITGELIDLYAKSRELLAKRGPDPGAGLLELWGTISPTLDD